MRIKAMQLTGYRFTITNGYIRLMVVGTINGCFILTSNQAGTFDEFQAQDFL
jgi:hypothetical protein